MPVIKFSMSQQQWSRRLLALTTFLLLTQALVSQIESTGAVPGDEFALAGMLYPLLRIWQIGNILLVALSSIFLVMEWRALGQGTKRVGIALLLLWVASVFALASAVAYLLVTAKDRDRTAVPRPAQSSDQDERVAIFGAALNALRSRDFLRWWAALGILAAISAYSIAMVESSIYTATFLDEFFTAEALSDYRLRLFDLSLTFGAGASLIFLLPVFLLKLGRVAGRAAILRASTTLASSVAVFIGTGLFFVMGDEIIATGVAAETLAMIVVFGHLLMMHLWCCTKRENYRPIGGEAPTALSAWGLLFLSLLTPPAFLLPRRLMQLIRASARIGYLTQAFFAALWLTVFVKASYPELEDFRSKLISLGVVISVMLLSLLLFACSQTFLKSGTLGRAKTRTIASCLAMLVAFALTQAPLSGEVALVLNEYSRFGFIIKKASLRELLRPNNQMGFERSAEPFYFHGDGEDFYPAKNMVPPQIGERPPIVVILWDAARYDHLGAYGYLRPTSPNLDRMAAEAVIFEQAYSGATATTCGVRHLFTGRYSTRYMLSKEHDPFFLHALREHGYRKFFITATGTDYNGVSMASFLRRGAPPSADGAQFFNLAKHPQGLNRERPDEEKTANVIKSWRDTFAAEGKAGLRGSLTFLHLTGTHFPWRNNNPIRDFGSSNIDRFDGETAKVDMLTGQAFDTLKELGVYDETIVILVADHGTGLREHGRWAGFLPYEEQIRVPLIVKIPGIAPKRVIQAVSTIDIAPTLLSLFEAGGPNKFHGISLLPLMADSQAKAKRRYLVSLCAFEDAYALVADGRYKLHLHRRENYGLLFDLKRDPQEKVNLYDLKPDLRDELLGVMGAFLWEGRSGFANPYHYRDWQAPRSARSANQ